MFMNFLCQVVGYQPPNQSAVLVVLLEAACLNLTHGPGKSASGRSEYNSTKICQETSVLLQKYDIIGSTEAQLLRQLSINPRIGGLTPGLSRFLARKRFRF